MKVIDNINSLLGDDLKTSLTRNSKLKIAASCFSIMVNRLDDAAFTQTYLQFAAVGIINKLEIYNGCILADSEPYDLIACFDKDITEDLIRELTQYQPLRVVFRDNGFASDAVKINAEQLFKQLSPSTEVKSI